MGLIENVIWGEEVAEKSEYRHYEEERSKIAQRTVIWLFERSLTWLQRAGCSTA